MFRDKQMLTYDYIRGLITGEGCFTFCSVRHKEKGIVSNIPTFALGMNERDKILVEIVKESLGLRNRIYAYAPRKRKDGYKRAGSVHLMVRDFGQLKNVIVPLCYKKLKGHKSIQFEEWIFAIESDPTVPKIYKLIPKIYKSGFYENIKKFD
ncbi:MAG: hypothetical protein HYY10_02540 [Candidatus Liptonbacteria bacterium]|nr:hypothetical protein [Candidatus Liptonbacteria bacterium]